MIKLNDSVFNQASDQAMVAALVKTAEQRLKAMGTTGYVRVIEQLRTSTVHETVVAKIEAKVNAATDKNQVILNVVKKGGTTAKIIVDILSRCF